MRPNYFKSCFLLLLVAALLSAHISPLAAASPSDAPSVLKDGETPATLTASDVSAHLIAASAQPSDVSLPARRLSGYDLLLLGREASSRIYREMSSIVCREQIDRFKGPFGDEAGHPLDVITSDVAMERGSERYSNIRQNNKARPS